MTKINLQKPPRFIVPQIYRQSIKTLDSDDVGDDLEDTNISGNPEDVLASPGHRHARIASLSDAFARPIKPLTTTLESTLETGFKIEIQQINS